MLQFYYRRKPKLMKLIILDSSTSSKLFSLEFSKSHHLFFQRYYRTKADVLGRVKLEALFTCEGD